MISSSEKRPNISPVLTCYENALHMVTIKSLKGKNLLWSSSTSKHLNSLHAVSTNPNTCCKVLWNGPPHSSHGDQYCTCPNLIQCWQDPWSSLLLQLDWVPFLLFGHSTFNSRTCWGHLSAHSQPAKVQWVPVLIRLSTPYSTTRLWVSVTQIMSSPSRIDHVACKNSPLLQFLESSDHVFCIPNWISHF